MNATRDDLALAVEGVRKEYDSAAGRLLVLKDVSLALAPGQSVAIVGPSGAGKSTLLNIIGSLDRPTAGSVRLGVAVARALVNEPPLLLCDEPTGNLDHDTASEVAGLFLELSRERGVMLVVVTHNLEQARLFGSCLELRDGVVHEQERGRGL
jgi:ABC-type lipoprotein export system ATPase subunit